MLISKLPDDLKALAEKRRAGDVPCTPDEDGLGNAIIWEATPEGFAFWNRVNAGQFDEARKLLQP